MQRGLPLAVLVAGAEARLAEVAHQLRAAMRKNIDINNVGRNNS